MKRNKGRGVIRSGGNVQRFYDLSGASHLILLSLLGRSAASGAEQTANSGKMTDVDVGQQ